MMHRTFIYLIASLALGAQISPALALDSGVRQLVVSIAPSWDSMTGKLQLFERSPDGSWRARGPAWPVLYGKHGLAWGRGVLGTDEAGLHKTERDGRAPAGVFKIGKIYTYDAALPEGADYPFHTVTAGDAWGDDPARPEYNRYLRISDPSHPPAWFEKAKMRQGDFAYRWLVEIRDNADPSPAPGAGSCIFFHIRRGETRPTTGCTTMAEPNLVRLVRWLRASAHPEYVLLPWDEYEKKWQVWGLPDPSIVDAKPSG